MIQIGIHSWVLETRHKLPEAMALAAQMGYDGYEIDIGNFGGTGLGLQILPDRMRDPEREQIKEAWKRARISICSLCLGALWHYPLSSPDETLRQRGVEITLAALDLAKDLGADCVLIPIPDGTGLDKGESWRLTTKSLESCVSVAEDRAVTLGIENVCSNFLLTAGDVARMADQFHSERCKVYYDAGNAGWLGFDPAADIVRLGDRLVRLHLKNWSTRRGQGESKTVSVCSPGVVDFPSVAEALRTSGYDGYVVVEVPTLNQDADAVAVENLRVVSELLG